MEVWVFGNPDLAQDALPIKLLPELKKQFPKITFVVKDPNEEWLLPKKLYIIDTVQDLNQVKVFTSLDYFTKQPAITMHDFDLGTQLQFLKKLEQLPPLVIFGIPMNISTADVLRELLPKLRQYLV
ncbi:MAG: hypothetical protein WC575_00840 [Patescibacteria group bacterium]